MPVKNRIVEAYKAGRPSFGIYVSNPSPRSVEWMGVAGFDFVRIDMDGSDLDLDTVHNMIYAAHAVGVTPIVRVPGDHSPADNRWIMQAVLGMGALGVIVPRVRTPADVEAAVNAVKLHPVGDRRYVPSPFLSAKPAEYAGSDVDWINENVVLSIQAETRAAVENIDEIVQVPGLDMVQSGRGDLSVEYGLPGEQYHVKVVEAEKRVVDAGLETGKMVSVQYYPMRDHSHVQIVQEWIEYGLHCLSLGSDKDVTYVIRRILENLK